MSKEKKNERANKLARVLIEAEFEIDSVNLEDVMMTVRNAIEELQAYGYVNRAYVDVPQTRIEFDA